MHLLCRAVPMAGMLLATPALAQSQLELGYYVYAEVSCAQASNATLTLVHWSGMNVSRVGCEFAQVTPVGQDTYGYVQNCTEIQSGQTYQSAGTIQITGTGSFVLANDGGAFGYRHCPQASLPEPWRSNDISDFVR